jgi:hypothetical protein
MLITESVEDADMVALADAVLPDGALVKVANVLPSKSEGTVTEPPNSPPDSTLCEPVRVMTDGDAEDELLWPAARPASHSSGSVATLMIDAGSSVMIVDAGADS